MFRRGGATVEGQGQQQTKDLTCVCDHCLEVLGKSTNDKTSTKTDTTKSAASSETTKTTTTATTKPSWQQTVKLLGENPKGYDRYPFLEKYAERVLQLGKPAIDRIRIEDLKQILQRRGIIVPESFLHPTAAYEGPRTMPSDVPPAAAASSGTLAAATSSAASFPVDEFVSKLTTGLATVLVELKRKKKQERMIKRRFYQQEPEEEEGEDEEQEVEDPQQDGEESGHDSSSPLPPVPSSRRARGRLPRRRGSGVRHG